MRPFVILLLAAAALRAAPAAALQADTARVGGVVVSGGGATGAFDPDAPRPVRRAEPSSPPAVPAAVHETAPFLAGDGDGIGPTVVGALAGDAPGRLGGALRVGESVLVRGLREAAPGVRLQSWRPGSTVAGAGRLAVPTAVLTVTDVVGEGIVAVVDRLLDRPAAGDGVRLLPPGPAVPSASLEPVSSGRRVVVRAAATPRSVLRPGDWVVLGAGHDAGLHPGDEFVPVDGPADLRDGARLQVVGVHDTASVARILHVGPTLLQPGRTLRLDRRAG